MVAPGKAQEVPKDETTITQWEQGFPRKLQGLKGFEGLEGLTWVKRITESGTHAPRTDKGAKEEKALSSIR